MNPIFLLIPAFLLSTLLGAALGLNLVPKSRYGSIILWASPILGIGVSALLFFLWTVLFYPTFATWAYVSLEISLAIAGIWVYNWRQKKISRASHSDIKPDLFFYSLKKSNLSRKKFDTPTLVLALFTFGCLSLFIIRFISYQNESPYGDWDAWAIWNMRARYLFLGGESWKSAFSSYLHGADYPILISLYTARTWTILGETNMVVPHVQAMVFSLSCAGLLFDSIRKVRTLFQGFLAASILLLTPSFIRGGVSQYADIPLSAYILLTGICFFYYLLPEDLPDNVVNPKLKNTHGTLANPSGLAGLAGVSAGFALWTKNEGLFLLAGVLLAQIILILFIKDRRAYLYSGMYFWICVFPALTFYAGFKLFVAPLNYVFDQTRGSLLTKLLDSTRHKTIMLELLKKPFSFGDWRIPLIPLVLAYGVFIGIDQNAIRKAWRGLTFIAATLSGIFVLYYAAYLVTTMPLEWQLKESLERLLLHIYPLSLFAVIYILRDPFQARSQDLGVQTSNNETPDTVP